MKGLLSVIHLKYDGLSLVNDPFQPSTYGEVAVSLLVVVFSSQNYQNYGETSPVYPMISYDIPCFSCLIPQKYITGPDKTPRVHQQLRWQTAGHLPSEWRMKFGHLAIENDQNKRLILLILYCEESHTFDII